MSNDKNIFLKVYRSNCIEEEFVLKKVQIQVHWCIIGKEAFGVSYEQELQNTKVELICRIYFMKWVQIFLKQKFIWCKKVTGTDTTSFARIKANLPCLTSKVEKLDVGELKSVFDHLNNGESKVKKIVIWK